jgi:glycine cleavage system aminomethyltransferase T
MFDTITSAGRPHGLVLVGVHAMDSLRMEKAYRHFGHDIGDEDHVLEAGLGFAVKADKVPCRFGTFIGRDAVLHKRKTGLTKRFTQFQLKDPRPLLYHTEPILRDGKLAGYLTSGAYGHYLGGAIGLGYVACRADETSDDMLGGLYEIEVAGERVAAIASLKPLYDPASARVKV